MIRVVAALIVVAALAGLWWHGYKKGERTDKARSDLVIAGMVADARARLEHANETARRQSSALQANKERAERDLQTERARNERRLADAVATDRLMRESIAEFAGGAGTSADSAAACVSRSQAFGVVLAGVLSDLGTCTAGAEHESAGARTLLEAWPVVGKNLPN